MIEFNNDRVNYEGNDTVMVIKKILMVEMLMLWKVPVTDNDNDKNNKNEKKIYILR